MSRPAAPTELPAVLFIEDVAAALRIEVGSVRNKVSKREIPMGKPGRLLMVPREVFIDWLRLCAMGWPAKKAVKELYKREQLRTEACRLAPAAAAPSSYGAWSPSVLPSDFIPGVMP